MATTVSTGRIRLTQMLDQVIQKLSVGSVKLYPSVSLCPWAIHFTHIASHEC